MLRLSQELLLLEEDVKALEEMYPQGEQVTHDNWLDIFVVCVVRVANTKEKD